MERQVTQFFTCGLVVLLFVACSSEGIKLLPGLGKCGSTCGNGPIYVVDNFNFVSATTGNVAPGYNIDGLNSDGSKSGGCFIEDQVAPDGTPGIDNYYSAILTALPPEIGRVLPDAIQNSVIEGGLIFLIELVDVEAFDQNSNIGLVVRYGQGEVQIDTDQRFVHNQRFELAKDPLLGFTGAVTLENRAVATDPFNLRFRLIIEATDLEFTLNSAQIRLTVLEDETIVGLLGGSVTTDDVLELISFLNDENDKIRETLNIVLPTLADVRSAETDTCDQISVALEFSGVPAFIAD